LQKFQEQLQRSVHFLKTATRQNTEERRLKRERVYADMYARSVRALGESPETQPLWERIAPVPVGNDAVAKDRLEILLQQHLDGVAGVDGSAIEHVADVLMGYFRQEQAIVREGSAIQQRINRLLGRAPPTRALTGSDLAIHYRLLASIYLPEQLADVGGRLPYFVDEIEEGLGLDVTITGESIELH
jgi:hypothetical protein